MRGPQGGYLLAKSPEEITVGMILRTLEGEITTSDCLGKEVCSRESICATRVIFEKIEKSINDVIDNITSVSYTHLDVYKRQIMLLPHSTDCKSGGLKMFN